MEYHRSSLRWMLIAFLLLALSTAAVADIIYLNTGGIVKGKIVDEDEDQVIIKTRFGEVPIDRDDIDFIERGTPKEIFQQRLKRINKNDSDAYVELAGWAQTVGLKEEAKQMFEKAIEIEPDNYFARAELGYRKYEGKWLNEEEYNKAIGLVKHEGTWVTKADAEKLQAGFVKYRDEWVKKEDLPMIKKGYRKLDGKWVTEEEYYKAKGYVKYRNKWMKPEKAEKLNAAEAKRKERERLLKLSKQIKKVFKIRCSFEPDAQKKHLEHFAGIVRKASGMIWDMTGGGTYIAEAHIYDKKSDGDVVVKNLDQNKVQTKGGKTAYGYASGGKMYVGGDCFVLTFVHEFGHAKFGLPDHYGETVICVMNADKGAKFMAWYYCDDCWKKIIGQCPGLKRPGKEGEKVGQPPPDFGEPPQTKITYKNN